MTDQKALISNKDDSLDIFEDEEIAEDEVAVAEVDDLQQTPFLKGKANPKLVNKRRLDDYLERKWFRENGWDDDDELFNDQYFE